MEKRKDLSITENVELVEAFEQERNMVSVSDVSKDYGIRKCQGYSISQTIFIIFLK